MIGSWAKDDPKMTPKSIQKSSKIDPKTGPGSKVDFSSIFDRIWPFQTLTNSKTPKENICFSRIGRFRTSHIFDFKHR